MRRRAHYGWYVVSVSFLSLGIAYGMKNTFSVFLTYIKADLPLSHAAGKLPFLVAVGLDALLAPFMGKLVDRVGPRWAIAGGGAVCGTSFLLLSTSHSLWQFVLYYGAGFGLAALGMGLVTCNTAITPWFKERLGLALGVASIGIGLAVLLLANVMEALMHSFGWRTTFVMLALFIWCTVIPLALFLKPGKAHRDQAGVMDSGWAEEGKLGTSLRQALRTPGFWFIFWGFFFFVAIIYGIYPNAKEFALDQGISSRWASFAVSLVGAFAILSKLFFGWLSDRVGDRKYAMVPACVILTSSCLVLIYTGGVGMLLLFAVLFGFGYSGYGPVLPAMVSDLYGRSNMGAIYGMVSMGGGIAGAVSPYLCGWIRDVTGSYTWAWFMLLCAGIVSMTSFLMVQRPARALAAPPGEPVLAGELEA
ncbi:MAG: MFS transporter [Candidatus Geothermincolia bacterium]